MKKLLLILLIALPMSISQEKQELPVEFYIKKSEKGTYVAQSIWFALDKAERQKILKRL